MCPEENRHRDGDGRPPDVLQGPGYRYRPRQILVGATTPQVDSVVQVLSERGGVPDAMLNRGFAEAGLPVLGFLMPPEVNIPDLVRDLRQQKPVPDIGPNYVFCGEGPPPPDYHGGPSGAPRDAEPLDESSYTTPLDVPVAIAVLDTGCDPDVPNLHKGLGWRIDSTPADEENPIGADGYITAEGGHGTFIDGVIMRVAPRVRIRHVKVLDPAGVGDDATVALAIKTHAQVPVINLSLGGYTGGDVPPVAMSAAIAALPASTVVVAAAGNNHHDRPFFPAAIPGVLAVGALDTREGKIRRAHFSNFGSWVRVYLPGAGVRSTYLQAVWKRPGDGEPHPIHGTACWNGTSFAAPQLAALIASAIPQAGTASLAAQQVLASAQHEPGLGAILLPDPGVIDCGDGRC